MERSELLAKLRNGIPAQSCDLPGRFIRCGRGECECDAELEIHDFGLSEAEVKHFEDLYRALGDFFVETA